MTSQPLTLQSILEAEKLLGIGYSDAERALMVDNLTAQVELAVKRRATRAAATLRAGDPLRPAPARLRHAGGPRRSGRARRPSRRLPEQRRGHRLRAGDDARGLDPHARDHLGAADRDLSRPDRADRAEARMHCSRHAGDARASRRSAPTRCFAAGTYLGPLHGIPWGCKDILDTAGIVTGWGAEPYRDRVPEQRRHRGREARRGGRRDGRQDHRRRARLWRHLVWRRHPQSVEPRRGLERLERRLGLGDRCRALCLRHRHRDARLDRRALAPLRRHRPPPDLRPGLARRRHAALLDARQDRADLPHGRGHGAGARRDQRP